MKKLYLVTGGTGHVGSVLISALRKRKEQIRVLALPGTAKLLPGDITAVEGDITNADTLAPFFERNGEEKITLIHCAGKVTIASKPDPSVWKINVNGTENIMKMAKAQGVDRVVYISSVHAIPERPEPEIMTEADSFSPDLVKGQYAKSKAAAAQIVLDYAGDGLNVSIVHPSGIIGPGDRLGQNHSVRSVRAMKKWHMPAAFKGGDDVVDVRDVVKGILACETKGRAGECYILSGHYATILELLNIVRRIEGKKPCRTELPYALARAAAPGAEWAAQRVGKKPPIFTPYSVETLHSNGRFSYGKAQKEFGYRPRSLEETIRATLWDKGTFASVPLK